MIPRTAQDQHDIERAADTLCKIAAIPSLHGGIVTFHPHGLECGWWYETSEPELWDRKDRVWMPVPDEPDILDCIFKVGIALDTWGKIASTRSAGWSPPSRSTTWSRNASSAVGNCSRTWKPATSPAIWKAK